MVWVLSLSSYPSWHAPSGSNSSLLFLDGMSSQQDISPKEPEQEPHNRFSLLPTIKPCPLTSDPWPHHVLYWLGIGWWCMGLTRALLLCMFEICLLLMHLPWSGGSSAQSAIHPWLLMEWAVFWCLILWWLAPLRGQALFDYEVFLLQLTLLFLPITLLPFPAVMLFDPSLLGFFGLAACSFLNDSKWSLGFLLHHLQTPVSHLFLIGHHWPIYFPWASLALFLTLYSHGFY